MPAFKWYLAYFATSFAVGAIPEFSTFGGKGKTVTLDFGDKIIHLIMSALKSLQSSLLAIDWQWQNTWLFLFLIN